MHSSPILKIAHRCSGIILNVPVSSSFKSCSLGKSPHFRWTWSLVPGLSPRIRLDASLWNTAMALQDVNVARIAYLKEVRITQITTHPDSRVQQTNHEVKNEKDNPAKTWHYDTCDRLDVEEFLRSQWLLEYCRFDLLPSLLVWGEEPGERR